jgi:hypothetical protein
MTLRNGYALDQEGGAVLLKGTASLTVNEVEFVNNFATWDGGAINVGSMSGSVTVTISVFDRNRSGISQRMALYVNNASSVSVRNSTFTGNGPGSITAMFTDAGTVRLVNLTIAANGTGGAIVGSGATTISISNSLLAGSGSLYTINGASVDAATSRNNVIAGYAADLSTSVNGNVISPNLVTLIGPLGSHGGPTRTMPLLPGSPAINAGTSDGGDIPNTDQRGIARVGAPDAGAFESRGFSMSEVSGSAQSAIVQTNFANPLVVSVSANQAMEPVAGGLVRFTSPLTGPSVQYLSDFNAYIDSDGRAQLTVRANATAGGPYNVVATVSGLTPINFPLTNLPNPCVGISFPYTLVGSDNSARLSNVRKALECANSNGASLDIIDLDGQEVALPADDIYATYDAATGLPQITSAVLIRNGTLRHDTSMGGTLFRTFDIAANGNLTVQNLRLLGDMAGTRAGAFLNLGSLKVISSTISGYSTGNRGGILVNESGATSEFVNVLAYNNNAVYAHAIDNYGAVNIINSTFAKHTSTGQFGFVLEGSGYTVRNSILWNAGSGPGMISAGNTVSNSLVRNGYTSGTSILNTDPLFINYGTDDYRLQAASPVVDVGVNSDVPADSTDVNGNGNTTESTPDRDLNPRIVGTNVDLGAYERQISTPSLSISDLSQNEGNSGTTNFSFTVSLSNPAPAGGVSFDIATANGTATAGSDYVARSLSSQTIEAGSSSYSFVVTVSGDTMVEPDETFFVTVSNVVGATVAAPQAQGTIVNDDSAAITIADVTQPENGTFTFSAVLSSATSAPFDVNWNFSPGTTSAADFTGGTYPTGGSLSFTGSAGETQTFTVPVFDDALVESSETFGVNLNNFSTSGGFTVDISDTAIGTITDNNTAGITVSPTSGLVTTEAGGTATFTVVLNSQPTANVTIGLTSSDTTEGVSAPASLTFTAANWNTPQTVTVTGVDDATVDGDVAYTIVNAAAVSADTSYNGLNPAEVSVTNTDNDVAGITVNPTSGLVTTEAGGTASFTIVLNSQPSANVTIGLSSSDTTEGVVAPASLTFTAANWNTPQTVTVIGVADAIADGDVAYTIITSAAVSADPNYNGIDPADVSVTNEEGELPEHEVGGTVVGLLGNGLELSLNGSETLPIASNGIFRFQSEITLGQT